MKVCIIGSGNQGTGLAGYLCQQEDCEKLVLIDNKQSAVDNALRLIRTNLGDKCKCSDITGHVADANDTDTIAELGKGCQLFFHAIDAKTNISVMKAALKANANYMDLRTQPCVTETCSYEETIDAQLDLDKDFKEKGLTAIPGCGVCPGWSSIAAANLIDRVDTVKSVILRSTDLMDTDELIAPVSPRILYALWMDGEPIVFENGELKAVDLIDSEEVYDFPAPVGKQRVYTECSSPEVVMFPKLADKEIPYMEAKMGITTAARDMKVLWLKGISHQTAKHTSSNDMLETFGESFDYDIDLVKFYKEGRLRNGLFCTAVEVTGEKDGVPVRNTVYYGTTLTEAMKVLPWAGHPVHCTSSGVTAEVVEMICRGELSRPGVISCISLKDLFETLNARLIKRGGFIISEKSLTGEGMF